MSKYSVSADVLRLLAAIVQQPAGQHMDYAAALGLPNPGSLRQWRIAHTTAFAQQCPAHASFIVSSDGNIGGEAARRVADFRRLLGVDVVPGRADELPGLLDDYAELAALAAEDVRVRHARAALLWEHLLSWLVPYLDSVIRSAPPPYKQWALLARDIFRLETAGIPAPQQLPLHLRAAPEAADLLTAESVDQAVCRLLTPIASGVVLTRADLARAPMLAQSEPVQKSRAVIIRYLLEQDGAETLGWLAREARQQAQTRAAERAWLGSVAIFWAQRATASADALATMATELDGWNLKRCG